MQSLESYRENAIDKIIKELIKNMYTIQHINFYENGLNISASTLSKIIYISHDLEGKNYRTKIFTPLDNIIFKHDIPNKICKKLNCMTNSETFSKIIEIPDIGEVKIIAKPDAFFGEFPIEIKSLYVKNRDIEKHLIKYGKWQSRMYGYILGKEKAYLVIGYYNIPYFNSLQVEISNIKVIAVDVDIEFMDKIIKKILKEIVIPYVIELKLTQKQ